MNLQFLETLVPALLHTLWIGLISAVLLFAALRITKVSSARLRYYLGIAALLAVLLGGLLAWEWPEAEQRAQPTPIQTPTRATSSLAQVTSLPETESAAAPAVENAVVRTAPVAPSPSVQKDKKPAKANQMDWRKPVGLCWMLGALISLLRLCHISWNIQQLVRKSRVIENETVQRLMAELSKTAGVSRRVLMLTGEHIVQPAVAGIFRPALFLPLSVVTGLPEWQLRAILAHELAHIVRNDFLVNALQLLAETLLFFNPAVWWISRRIREEREACCDALAAQWIDSKTALAETLIDQASVQSGTLPAFGGTDSGSLKNRILRLIHPSQKPHLKLPWKSLLLVLFFASSGLFLAKMGTAELVSYLDRFKTLEIARDSFATDSQKRRMDAKSPKIKVVEMTISTDDQEPLEYPIFIRIYGDNTSVPHRIDRYSSDIDLIAQDTLRTEIPIDGFHDITRYEVHAPSRALAGGEGVKPDSFGQVVLPPVILSKGFEATIRFVDDHGAPVEGVEVLIKPREDSVSSAENGIVVIPYRPHDQTELLEIVTPEGYLFKNEIECRFEPNRETEIQLEQATSYNGIIRNARGEPVIGAKITPAPTGWNPWWDESRRFTTASDKQGHFAIRRFSENETFNFIVEAAGYMTKLVSSAQVGAPEELIMLRDAKKVQLLVKNAAKREGFDLYVESGSNEGDSFEWRYGYTHHLDNIGDDMLYEIELVDAHNFSIGASWYDAPRKKTMSERLTIIDIANAEDKLTIDGDEALGEYRPAVSCKVTLRFIPPNGEPMPNGTIELVEEALAERGIGISVYPIPENGILNTRIMVHKGEPVLVRPRAISGYTIQQTIHPVSTNYVADCQLVPAGGIVIRCVDEKGNPITGFSVYTKTERLDDSSVYFHPIIRAGESDSCLREPLALGTTRHKFQILKYRPESEGGYLHYSYSDCDWITLTEDEPVKELTCVLRPVE